MEISAPSSVSSVRRKSSSRTPSTRRSVQSSPPGRTLPRSRGPSKCPLPIGATMRVPRALAQLSVRRRRPPEASSTNVNPFGSALLRRLMRRCVAQCQRDFNVGRRPGFTVPRPRTAHGAAWMPLSESALMRRLGPRCWTKPLTSGSGLKHWERLCALPQKSTDTAVC